MVRLVRPKKIVWFYMMYYNVLYIIYSTIIIYYTILSFSKR